MALDVTEGIFAVLYVSIMGLTRFYKKTVFLHLSYVMAACVADAYIIFLPCGFFFYLLFFFPRQISAVAEWMSTILLHMVWP